MVGAALAAVGVVVGCVLNVVYSLIFVDFVLCAASSLTYVVFVHPDHLRIPQPGPTVLPTVQ